MTQYHISVGSNIDPDQHVPSGLRRLHDAARIVAASPFYITAAIERPDQDDYWNGIVVIDTDRDEAAMRGVLRRIEAEEGRVRGPDKWAARELDLDILMIDGHAAAEVRAEIADRPWLAHSLHDIDPSFPRPDWDAPRAPAPWPL